MIVLQVHRHGTKPLSSSLYMHYSPTRLFTCTCNKYQNCIIVTRRRNNTKIGIGSTNHAPCPSKQLLYIGSRGAFDHTYIHVIRIHHNDNIIRGVTARENASLIIPYYYCYCYYYCHRDVIDSPTTDHRAVTVQRCYCVCRSNGTYRRRDPCNNKRSNNRKVIISVRIGEGRQKFLRVFVPKIIQKRSPFWFSHASARRGPRRVYLTQHGCRSITHMSSIAELLNTSNVRDVEIVCGLFVQ